MQVERQIMNVPAPDRINWNDAEWDLVAAELKRQNPTRQTTSYFRFDFTIMELEDAAEQVLPQSRQRSFDTFDEARRALFNAFERMKPNAKNVVHVHEGKSRIDGAIYWSPQEWEAVAEELNNMIPGVFERRCNGVGINEVNLAQSILPVNRRRIFKQVVGFRASVLKTWEHILASKKDAAPPVIIDFTTGPIMEPPQHKSHDGNAIATAMHEAFQAGPVEKKPRKTKVFWTQEEWLAVAREMRRQNPHCNFFASKFTLIDLPAIREAQRIALPLERRRSLGVTKGLQEPLVTTFKMLLQEVEQENLANSAIEPYQEQPEIAFQEDDSSGVIPVPEVAQVAYSQPVQLATSGQSTDFPSAVLNAASPLVNLMIDEIVKRLLPQLSSAIASQISLSVGDVIQKKLEQFIPRSPVHGVPTTTLPAPVPAIEKTAPIVPTRFTAAEIAAFNNVTIEKTKKPKIVLLGPTGRQKNDIEGAFPEYEFNFIENGHGIKEACSDCELFIVYTSHFNSANKAAVKRFLDHDKLRQVQGSMSSVKHQIHSWQAMNAVKKGL